MSFPLVMVTTNSESEYLGKAMEAGANEYIEKPCTLEMLRDKLNVLGLTTSDCAQTGGK
jgi:DNA-binding response OmpR family regulator